MKQMLSGLERSREVTPPAGSPQLTQLPAPHLTPHPSPFVQVTQRDAAGAQHGAFLLQSRLDEVSREREGLAQQLEIEKGRVEQLEQLATTLRAASQQSTMGVAEVESDASEVTGCHCH